ncbi:MAG: hypothetical protein RR327_06235, partial [Clostridia bacterium]
MDKKINDKQFGKDIEITDNSKAKAQKPHKNFKKVAAACVSFALVLAIAITGISIASNKTTTAHDFYLSVDINPSVEFTGNNGVVETVRGLNADGVIVAKSIEKKVLGQSPEAATSQYVERAKELKYITDTLPNNAIVVNTSSSDPKVEQKLNDAVKENTEKFLKDNNIKGEVVSNLANTSDEIKAQAEKLHITVGKMNFILKAQALHPEMTLEELAAMDTNKINEIAKKYDKTKLEAFEKEIEKMEEDFEKELEVREQELETKIGTINTSLESLTATIDGIKTEEDLAKYKAEIAKLKEQFPELQIDETKITLENIKDSEGIMKDSLDTIKDKYEADLENIEEDFEKELEKYEQSMKDKADELDKDDDEEDD